MNELDTTYQIMKKIKNVQESLRQNFEKQFKEKNLTGPQAMLIGVLVHQGEMKISDLSKEMCLSNSTISGIIDRLEKNGFVERKRSEKDRRVVMIDLTENFRKEAKTHFEVVQAYFKNVMEFATEEEIQKVLTGLEILDNLMNQFNKDKNNKE